MTWTPRNDGGTGHSIRAPAILASPSPEATAPSSDADEASGVLPSHQECSLWSVRPDHSLRLLSLLALAGN